MKLVYGGGHLKFYVVGASLILKIEADEVLWASYSSMHRPTYWASLYTFDHSSRHWLEACSTIGQLFRDKSIDSANKNFQTEAMA